MGCPGEAKSVDLKEVWEPMELATEPWEDREEEDSNWRSATQTSLILVPS